ncbi:glycerate kinase [Rhizomonospora bruguierae]|uniref:glycerate kinase n=1 Tax=Rhizomonospora bruguierae TaxID=1581705 RepID=UPI001BCF6925|nr:glycerate kinase [Micromonospora sp. NBRC 107566]
MATVVVAPDTFKGSLAAVEVADALARGWRSVRPRDEVVELPLADGGEGTLDVVERLVPGARRVSLTVAGPLGDPRGTSALLLPDGTAVVEIAASSGLPLLTRASPLQATSRGLGETLRHMVEAGARRCLVALGGSSSTDGGTGALSALGVQFLDGWGAVLPDGGGSLARLDQIDIGALVSAPDGGVELLVDVAAPLLGGAGAATTFGPQKGAGPAEMAALEAGLRRLADILGGDPDRPGSGAAGGAAYGLATVWGARISPGSTAIAELAGLPAALNRADVVITGEGRFDRTSSRGKVPGHVLTQAGERGTDAYVVCGVRDDAELPRGTHAITLVDICGSTDAAMAGAGRGLVRAGARAARHWEGRRHV